MIKEYNNKAAHDAATRSTTESEASLLLDTRETLIDGVNVKISLSPKVGDIVCHDANGKVHFIALDTFHALPSGWVVIGVIAHRQGRRILVAYKSQASKKFSDVYQWIVTGYTLDGESHECAVTLHGEVDGTFTYAASSKSEFKSQFSDWILEHELASYHYSVHEDADGNIILQLDNYSAYEGGNSITGLTLTPNVATELPAISSAPRVDGNTTYWAGMCRKKFFDYYSVSGTTPESQVALTSTDVVNLTAFKTNAYCDLLRGAYCVDPANPTDDDYIAYLDANMVRVPYTRGVMAELYRDGKANTKALASVTYEDQENQIKIKYPAANYAAGIGFEGVKGFEVGDFYIPSPAEWAEVMRDITYGGAGVSGSAIDPINRSLVAVSGSPISCTAYYWLAARYDADYAWIYYGSFGNIDSAYFYSAFTVVPVALYTLAE